MIALPGILFKSFFDYVRLGGINENRSWNPRRDLFKDGADVALFILADDRAAQVEHVRTVIRKLFGQGKNVVIFLGANQVAEMFDAGGSVHFLSDD